MTHFVYMNTQKWLFKKKATFVRSEKVEMISTFQRNRHFRKVSVNKTFTHVQEQKKRFRLRSVQCKIALTHVIYLLFTLPLRMTANFMCSILLFLLLAWVGLGNLQHLRWSPLSQKSTLAIHYYC